MTNDETYHTARPGDKFKVIQGYNGNPFSLSTGTTVRRPNPGVYVPLPEGYVIEFECEAPNGNVWFEFVHPETGKPMRGKSQSGSIHNLITNGCLTPDR